jgi:arylsulfatase A-like enzyme
VKSGHGSSFAAGCSRAPVGNVVIVLVDQLRPDSASRHLTGVNALAENGVVFEGMRASAPWTYPSVISLMSGLYPQQHGADGHATDNILSQFDPEVPLLHGRLRAAGYATAAFITNSFLLEWNVFHEGFDHFDGGFVRSQGPFRGHERVWIPERMFAHSVNEAIRAHFDATPYRRPEFTYVHYIDVHGPWKRAPFAPNYPASIRFVDRHVVALYEYFLARYDGDVIFVVTSDHGRALGDDVQVGAGPEWRKQKHSVHDYNLRIPFLILPSRWVDESRRIPGPCSNIDVAPTLLAWLGQPPLADSPGRNLLPVIRGEETLDGDRAIFARNSAFGSRSDGVVYRGRKYVEFFDVETQQPSARRVFDLARDPREMRSLSDDFGEAENVVREAAGDHGRAYDARFGGVSPEIEAQLRALGYLPDKP